MSSKTSVESYNDHDEHREWEFELDNLLSLSTQERLAMMLERSDEVKRALIRHGHRKPVEIIFSRRAAAKKFLKIEQRLLGYLLM